MKPMKSTVLIMILISSGLDKISAKFLKPTYFMVGLTIFQEKKLK